MKVQYKFVKDSDGYCSISSNLKVEGLDMLELLSSDIVERTYHTFLNCIEKKEYWWSNTTKVEFEGGNAVISPAFHWGEEDDNEIKVYVSIKDLKIIMEKWIEYLKENNNNV